jgi:nucleotide-binding universal stress UspA family protein
MPVFRRILVAVDFSAHSEAALRKAVEIATESGSKLRLLHCYPIQPGGVSPYGVAPPTSYFAEIRAAAARRLGEWRQKFVPAEIDADEILSSDFPSASITEGATDFEADLIVMGTRGTSGLKHLVLGSVADQPSAMRPVRCWR